MKPYHANDSELARQNKNFRKVLYTTPGGQLVIMSLLPSEDIGVEVHHEVDQWFWIVAGTAKAILDGQEYIVREEEVLVVPRGTEHNVINASTTNDLKLFTVYTPPNHPDGTVHATKADAMADEHDHH